MEPINNNENSLENNLNMNKNDTEKKENMATNVVPFMPILQNPELTPLSDLPINVYTDLENIKVAYIGIEKDIFRIFHCQEKNSLSLKIYYLDENNKINVLFNVNEHFVPKKCCSCCTCDLINCCCCAYLYRNKIIYQLDYLKNNLPFATLGYNLPQGCYCCKVNCCESCCTCPCCNCRSVLSKLYLRINNNPSEPDLSYGKFLGKTTAVLTNCCDGFSNKVEIVDENGMLRWIVGLVRKCCNCKCCCCDCCHCCDEVFSDKFFEIYDANMKLCGSILVPYGICSVKLEKDCCCYKSCCGGCCSCYRVNPYYEIHFPEIANSLDKFYILSAVMMFELHFKVIQRD